MSKLYDENIFEYTGESVQDDRYVIGTYYLEDSVPGETFIDHLQMVASSRQGTSTSITSMVVSESWLSPSRSVVTLSRRRMNGSNQSE